MVFYGVDRHVVHETCFEARVLMGIESGETVTFWVASQGRQEFSESLVTQHGFRRAPCPLVFTDISKYMVFSVCNPSPLIKFAGARPP